MGTPCVYFLKVYFASGVNLAVSSFTVQSGARWRDLVKMGPLRSIYPRSDSSPSAANNRDENKDKDKESAKCGQ